MSENNESDGLRVHVINDGGGVYWYVASSPEEAMREHVRVMYTQTGLPLSEGDPDHAGVLPDDKPLTVVDRIDGPPTRTAREWANTGRGFLATTEF